MQLFMLIFFQFVLTLHPENDKMLYFKWFMY